MSFALVLRQDGVYFKGPRIENVCMGGGVGGDWKNSNQNQLTASEFDRTDLNNDAQPQHPDFSCAGTPIDLGFISYNQTGGAILPEEGPLPYEVVGHVDEWSADVTFNAMCNPPPNLTIEKKG